MANRTVLFTTTGMITAFILATIFLVRGCNTSGKLNSTIDTLTESQSALEREKDSLLRELQNRTGSLNALEAERDELNSRIAELDDRIKALAASSAARAARLKESEEAGRQLQDSYDAEAARSRELQDELNGVRSRMAVVESELHEARAERDRLLAENRIKEEKRIADSIAKAAIPEPLPERTHGWYVNTTELAGAYGLATTSIDYANWFAGISNVFGYAFSKRMTGGIGTGIQIYNGGAMLPLYLDFRYDLPGGAWTPFLVADGGLTLPLKALSSTGAFISPSIGIKRMLNEKSALHLSLGGYTQMTPSTARSSFLLLRAGLTFNTK